MGVNRRPPPSPPDFGTGCRGLESLQVRHCSLVYAHDQVEAHRHPDDYTGCRRLHTDAVGSCRPARLLKNTSHRRFPRRNLGPAGFAAHAIDRCTCLPTRANRAWPCDSYDRPLWCGTCRSPAHNRAQRGRPTLRQIAQGRAASARGPVVPAAAEKCQRPSPDMLVAGLDLPLPCRRLHTLPEHVPRHTDTA